MAKDDTIDCRTLLANCLGVFQGGGCRGVAYVGAFKEAQKAGIGFSEVAGTSAGSIFAALIAAGGTPEQLEEIVKSGELPKIPVPVEESGYAHWLPLLFIRITKFLIKFRNLLKSKENKKFEKILSDPSIQHPKRTIRALWNRYGVYNSDNLISTMERWLKIITGKDSVTFAQLKLPLYVFASDIYNHRYYMWSKNTTPDYPVAKAVAASCSIPFYFTPIIGDQDKRQIFVDGGLLINRPDYAFDKKPNYFQILSFKLEAKEKEIKDLWDYAGELVTTIIYGADELQHRQPKVDEDTFGDQWINEITINTGDISATDFSSLDQNTINSLIKVGETQMKIFIQNLNDRLRKDKDRKYAVTPRKVLEYKEEVFNQVAFWSYEPNDSIIISDINFDWVWSLFPTLISWINQGTKIKVYHSQDVCISNHEQMAKRRLAVSLGCEITPIEKEKLIKGFFFKKGDELKCILFDEDSDGEDSDSDKIKAKVYNDKLDSNFIKVIKDHLGVITTGGKPLKIELKEIEPEEIYQNLKTVPEYKMAEFDFRECDINKLRFLKNKVRSLKYKELRHIQTLYNRASVRPLYSPAKLILTDNKESLMTPIIVEDQGENGFVVIKGNARCLKAYHKGERTVKCIVVTGCDKISNNLHSYGISDLYLSEQKNRGAVQENIKVFRGVDQALRPNDTYLK